MSIFVVILSPGADDGLVVGVDDEAEDLVDLDDMDKLDEFEELFPIVERVLSARERNGMDRDIDRISINITLALIDLLIGCLLSLANPLFRQEFHSTLLEAGGLKITPEDIETDIPISVTRPPYASALRSKALHPTLSNGLPLSSRTRP